MASSIIGQLRVILGLDTAQFERGITDSQRQMTRAARSYEQIGQRIERVGKSLSVGVTLPLVAIGGASLRMASDFESAMNKVAAATGATGAQLKALRDQAKAFGADQSVPATAAQTASAMENLAKNGRSVQEILGGATEATLKLSAATGSELPAAADLATDVMAQFGKQASELPALVDKMSGAMVASKLDFENYRMAIGQAGAVAGNTMSFEDFNAAIAATAAGFASGSDAGTSFKTFLQRLNPQSKEAAGAMKALGVDFFDAKGQFIGIGASADILKDKLAGLTQEAQADFLTKVFGSDSARTAIQLMKQGADGIAQMRAQIDQVSASDQAASLMRGWAGAVQQVKKSFEAASIAFGDSGFLDGMTAVATAVSNAIRAFASLPSPVLQTVGAFAAVAAAAGPVIFVIGKMFSVWGVLLGLGPRLAVQLGIIAGAETAVGAAGGRAAAGVGLLSRSLALLGGPWGIAIMAIGAAIGYLAMRADEAGPATQEAAKGLRELAAQQGVTKTASDGLATATKSATSTMEGAIVKARDLATQLYGVEAGAKAAMLALARHRVADAMRAQAKAIREDDRSWVGVWRGVGFGQSARDKRKDQDAARNRVKAEAEMALAQKAFDQAVAAAQAKAPGPSVTNLPPSGTGTLPSGSGGGRKGKGSSGPSFEELAARRAELELQAKITAAQEAGDDATASALRDRLDLTRQIAAYQDAGLTKAQATVAAQRDLSAIQAARATSAAREVAREQDALAINVAQIRGDEMLAEKLERQRDIAERILFYRRQNYDVARATAQAEADQVKVDEARADVRRQWFDQDARDRNIRLAEMRGDSEDRLLALHAENDAIARQRDLERQGLSPTEARARALTEAMETERARQQGIFRDTIKGGFRAAFDGDIGGWFKGWWKDRVAKGMEEALNSLSDLIASLFSRSANGSGAATSIGDAIGQALRGGKSFSAGTDFTGGFAKTMPGFATGGSFSVGGRSGIDRNLVAFRATKGEMVNITKGQKDAGPLGSIFVDAPLYMQGAVDLATRDYADRVAVAHSQNVRMAISEAQRRRG